MLLREHRKRSDTYRRVANLYPLPLVPVTSRAPTLAKFSLPDLAVQLAVAGACFSHGKVCRKQEIIIECQNLLEQLQK